MEINYIGEHLLPGIAGKSLIYLAFLGAIFSVVFYIFASRNKSGLNKWDKRADYIFVLHSLSLFISGALLMFLLLNRYYEYKYVWIHAENNLGAEYLIAGFWAGQEGSFLFWTICQAIFGFLIIRFEGSFKNEVMLVLSLSQVFMTSMILGISIGTVDIGMSPFLLLREASENIDDPFFSNPEYLKLITDGNGLNPLLRNFWMMSHPPVLFIGFAAALLPFAYAIAGMWKKQYHQWIRPALPWTLSAILFLGAGLMLGGVWAYESLTFGGFWAWDPVENASLVPWLILLVSLHLMLIAKKNKNTFLPVFIFTILAFLFVIYSTFLTRSGILAETSVHSFGNDGMGLHILLYIVSFIVFAVFFIIKNIGKFPIDTNKDLFSKEFWLFIAALIIVLSAFQIIFTTSLPVINKISGANFAPPTDVVAHYNKWQTPFAIIIALMLGVGNYLKWGKNKSKEFIKSSWFVIVISFTVLIITLIFYPIQNIFYQIMLLFGYYALFSALDNLFRFKQLHISTGAAISHLGFALFLIAIILTFSKKEVISKNTSGFSLGGNFSEQENLLLIKDEILPMGNYHLVYKSKEMKGERIIYTIDFLKKNKEGNYYKAFSSFPSILINEKMGNVFEPYSKIYLFKDIFTYITFAEVEKDKNKESLELINKSEIALKDTILVNNNKLVFNDIKTSIDENNADNKIIVTANFSLITHFGQVYTLLPKYQIDNGEVVYKDDLATDLGIVLRLSGISEKPYHISIEVLQEREEFIIVKTILFPFINILWLSLIIMLIGIFIALRKRWKQYKNIIQ